MKVKNNRLFSTETIFTQVELLNTIFIITVLLLHHGNYTYNALWLLRVGKITPILQKLAVGGFLFLSGYKLTKSKSTVQTKKFITNRFFRIYILYFIAVIFFSLSAYPFLNSGNLPSWQNVFLHMLCLQAIVPGLCQNLYSTLWFVSVLFWCYTFFLILRKFLQNLYFFYTVLIVGIIFVFTLSTILSQYNINLFINYLNLFLTYFALGMLYSINERRINSINNRFLVFLCFLCFVILTIFYNCISLEYVNSCPLIKKMIIRLIESILLLASTIPLYIIALKMSFKRRIKNKCLYLISITIKLISYSSLCIFLFHRSIWAIMANIWGKGSFYQWVYLMIFGIPLIIVFCYAFQVNYDKIINDYSLRNRPEATR